MRKQVLNHQVQGNPNPSVRIKHQTFRRNITTINTLKHGPSLTLDINEKVKITNQTFGDETFQDDRNK